MIVFNYLAKEIFRAFGGISAVLGLIFISHQTVRYLKFTALGTLPGTAIVNLLLLEMPQLLSLIVPLGWYLSVWFVYSRLSVDNEMTVLKACGLSEKRFLKWTAVMTFAAAALLAFLVGWLNPLSAKSRNALLDQIKSASVLKILQPGYFQKSNDGKQVFYIENLSADKRFLKNIFGAEYTGKDAWSLMTATQGYYTLDPVTHDHFMVIQKAYRYEGIPGEKNFTFYRVGEYGIRLNVSPTYLPSKAIDTVSMRDLLLYTSKNLAYRAEWQWRLSLPFSLFILAFFAFLLSTGRRHTAKPREGRFSGFFSALLIYIIYADFMLLGQDWISKGQFPPLPGLWALHGVMFLAGLALYAHQHALFKRDFFFKRRPAL